MYNYLTKVCITTVSLCNLHKDTVVRNGKTHLKEKFDDDF